MREMAGDAHGFGVALGGGTARAYAHVAELWRQAFDRALDEASLIRGRRLEAWLDRKLFAGATFDDVAIPLVIACTDVRTGALTLLREGPLARAVVASCALPGLFAPVIEGDRALIDGGFVESVPFRALASLGSLRPLGLHAGIDTHRSACIGVIRAANASRAGHAWLGWCARRRGRHAWSRLARGLALAAASYERTVQAPPGGWLLAMRPPIAWWDFHRSLEAMRAGALAVEVALAARGFGEWLLSGTPRVPEGRVVA